MEDNNNEKKSFETEGKYRKSNTRRKALKSIVAGSSAVAASSMLPEKWTKPVIDSVALPAHAQTSFTSLSATILNLHSDDTSDTLADQGPFNAGSTVVYTLGIGDARNDISLPTTGVSATTNPGQPVHLHVDFSSGDLEELSNLGTTVSDFDAVADPTTGIANFPDLSRAGNDSPLVTGDVEEGPPSDFFQFTFSTPGAEDAVIRWDFFYTQGQVP